MKRVGNRGEAKWKRLSTDEALDEIAQKLKGLKERYGAESLAWCTGIYHGPDCAMEIRFLNLFGSPNFTGPGIPCAGPALEAEAITYGFGPTGAGFPPPEPGKTKCIVIWGHRPKASVPPFWQAIRRCKEAGAKLIVIDPFCGIGNGEWVYIENTRGKVKQKAEVTDRIAPGVVQADRWWYPELPGEEPCLHGVWISNINCLTDDDPDSCGQAYGSWPYRALLCKVYKATD